MAGVGSDKIRLSGSWTNLVGKVFLSIVTFDQLGGPDSRLADWSGWFSHVTETNDWYKNFSVTNFPRAVTGWSNTFDQLAGPDSRLADWCGRFRQAISPMTGIRISQ